MRLKDKIVVVTGAGRGIGAAVAKKICEEGGHAVIGDLTGSEESTRDDLRKLGYSCESAHLDVTDSASISQLCAKLMDQHGRIDGLVANAATNNDLKLEDISDGEWRRMMSVNLDGVFYCVREVGRHMLAKGSGSVVCISSICAVKSVRPEFHPAYDISKAAVANLCRIVGAQWAPRGVRVNAVGPGYTETEMLKNLGLTQPDIIAQWIEDIPMGRLLQPSEIASVISFLLSEESSAITAQLIFADGGYTSA